MTDSIKSCLDELKEMAKGAILQGRLADADRLYTEALAIVPKLNNVSEKAALLTNRSLVRIKSRQHTDAQKDALEAIKTRPSWPRGYMRFAQSLAQEKKWKQAVKILRKGEAATQEGSSLHNPKTDIRDLLDEIAVEAAKHGSEDGFDGRLLEVRPAGKDAWLGLPAPEDEAKDKAPSHLRPALTSSSSAADPAAVASEAAALQSAWQRTSFRSVHEALEAARDGDRIVLHVGTHNTGHAGCSLAVNKRVLISGPPDALAGPNGAVIDHRGNTPLFNITRACVIKDLAIDMTGFKDCFFVNGGPDVKVLVHRCPISCSGDVCGIIAGACHATFANCTFTGSKGGLRIGGNTKVVLIRSEFFKCGGPSVTAMQRCEVSMSSCNITDCKHDSVVVTQSARALMAACSISGGRGPGIDVSGQGEAALQECRVEGNRGGLWMWDQGRCRAVHCLFQGGDSHALLVDGLAQPELTRCKIVGIIHSTDMGWDGIKHHENTVVEIKEPTELPPEVEPFIYKPDPIKGF